MTDEGQLFVSYSRADSEFVRRLVAALEARGRDPWVDWEDIPKAADWWADIQSAITGSDAFVFVLSPDSARSEVCGRELAAAEADHKRIVPVLARMAPVDEIPALIKRLNWIDFQANVDFDGAVGQLVDAVDTDLEWVKEHTRLAVRARDWESASREPSRLLRGRELDAGELWLARAADHAAPQPTTLQSAYLLASRQAATRSQRVRLALAVVAAIVALSLAAMAVVQSIEADRQRADAVAQRAEAITLRDVAQSERDEAKRQRDIAETEAQRNLARSLAARAGDRTHSFDVSLLLAAEGMALDDSAETRSGIFAALQAAVRMKYFLHGLDEGPFTVAADPAGRWLAAGGIGALQLWNSADGTPIKSIALGGPDGNYVVDLAVGNDGDLLAYSSLDGVVVLDSTQDFAERKRFDVDTVGLVALDAANGRVAMGTYDGSVRLAAIDGSSDFTFVPAEGAIDGLAFASDAKRLAVGVGKQLSIWDVSGAQPTVVGSPVDLPGDIVDVEFSADGRWLAASTTDESSPLLSGRQRAGRRRSCGRA